MLCLSLLCVVEVTHDMLVTMWKWWCMTVAVQAEVRRDDPSLIEIVAQKIIPCLQNGMRLSASAAHIIQDYERYGHVSALKHHIRLVCGHSSLSCVRSFKSLKP